jgi:hypothetical protein
MVGLVLSDSFMAKGVCFCASVLKCYPVELNVVLLI